MCRVPLVLQFLSDLKRVSGPKSAPAATQAMHHSMAMISLQLCLKPANQQSQARPDRTAARGRLEFACWRWPLSQGSASCAPRPTSSCASALHAVRGRCLAATTPPHSLAVIGMARHARPWLQSAASLQPACPADCRLVWGRDACGRWLRHEVVHQTCGCCAIYWQAGPGGRQCRWAGAWAGARPIFSTHGGLFCMHMHIPFACRPLVPPGML